MNIKIRIVSLCAILYLFNINNIYAQKVKSSIDSVQRNSINNVISFLELSLNILGDPKYNIREKEEVINSSYLKVFLDNKVQIEDDLDTSRDVSIFKDVQAYLKDITFFYKKVHFSFKIEEIVSGVNDHNEPYHLVNTTSKISGINIKGDSIHLSQPRYIELNISPKTGSFKIVSIYTNELNNEEALISWWNGLSTQWKGILGDNIFVKKDVPLSNYSIVDASTFKSDQNGEEIKNAQVVKYLNMVTSKDSINLKDNPVESIRPLEWLKLLKFLDISNTKVASLFGIRNAQKLQYLNLSGTGIKDIKSLAYLRELRELDMSYTSLDSLETLQYFNKLEDLKLNNTKFYNVELLKYFPSLRQLDVHSTSITDLRGIEQLGMLEYLDLSKTKINDLQDLSVLPNLKVLKIEGTNVNDLAPLNKCVGLRELWASSSQLKSLDEIKDLKKIELIDINKTAIGRDQIIKFSRANPTPVVLFANEKLASWWKNMEPTWKGIILKGKKTTDPDVRLLHKLIKMDSINVSGNAGVTSLDPLKEMLNIKYLNASLTNIQDLTALSNQVGLVYLDVSETKVGDLGPIKNSVGLKYIKADKTEVNSLAPLKGFKELEEVSFERTPLSDFSELSTLPKIKVAYFDHTQIDMDDFESLVLPNDNVVVIFNTAELRSWWGNLEDEWQNIFIKQLSLEKRPTKENLHKILSFQNFTFNSLIVKDLSPVGMMVKLKELHFFDTQIRDLDALKGLKQLEVLECPRNPIENITAISGLENMRILDLSNNAQIDDIEALKHLSKLEKVNISSTNVKKLDPLKGKDNLVQLDCSNTKVRSLEPIDNIESLKSLRCFNTKISEKKVEDYVGTHLQCEVVFY